MYLERLELTGFRNYSRQVVEPSQCYNILTGKNAQGKTNLLESIFLACTGRSFRTAREKEIINWESSFSRIQCSFKSETRDFEVKILLFPGKKNIEVNGNFIRGCPLGWPGVVLFTPDDLVMVKGSPNERRHFLDLEIGPFHPQYGHVLSGYNRVVQQRNKLLREIKEKKQKSSALEVWNEQFCRYGAKLLSIRLDLLKKFYPMIRNLHRELTGGTEDLNIRYLSSLKVDDLSLEEEIYDCFRKEIRVIERMEIERAQSLIGPHRDDLSFYLNGSDARVYGSQGQQRTIVLTLKIFQIRQWKDEVNDYPILLLDDVLFELDLSRQQALINQVNGFVQSFITYTGEENLNLINATFDRKIYNVSMGKIIEQ